MADRDRNERTATSRPLSTIRFLPSLFERSSFPARDLPVGKPAGFRTREAWLKASIHLERVKGIERSSSAWKAIGKPSRIKGCLDISGSQNPALRPKVLNLCPGRAGRPSALGGAGQREGIVRPNACSLPATSTTRGDRAVARGQHLDHPPELRHAAESRSASATNDAFVVFRNLGIDDRWAVAIWTGKLLGHRKSPRQIGHFDSAGRRVAMR